MMEQPAGSWTRSGLVEVPAGTIAFAELGPTATTATGAAAPPAAPPADPVVLLHKLGGWNADWRYCRSAGRFECPGTSASDSLGFRPAYYPVP